MSKVVLVLRPRDLNRIKKGPKGPKTEDCGARQVIFKDKERSPSNRQINYEVFFNQSQPLIP